MWKAVIQRDDQADEVRELDRDHPDTELQDCIAALEDLIIRRGYRSVKVVRKGKKETP